MANDSGRVTKADQFLASMGESVQSTELTIGQILDLYIVAVLEGYDRLSEKSATLEGKIDELTDKVSVLVGILDKFLAKVDSK